MIDAEALRVGFAFTAGAATFFAPCSFPLLPGYVSYYLGRSTGAADSRRVQLRRAGLVGLITSLGFFIVYGALTSVVVVAGTQALTNISVLELIVGSLLVLLGGAMATGPTARTTEATDAPTTRSRTSGASNDPADAREPAAASSATDSCPVHRTSRPG